LVSRGDGPLLDAYQAGDEAVLMAERLPGVPIVKGKNRYEAGMFARANITLPAAYVESQVLFILDDGFQHWALHRDKDILLIDGTNPFGNRKLFPLGRLREPLTGMRRADIVVITNVPNEDDGTESVEIPGEGIRSLNKEIRQYTASAQIYLAQHSPTTFKTVSGNSLALSDMKSNKVFAFCGIGNPHSFQGTLLPLIGELTGIMFFRDHYQYSRADLRRIAVNAAKSGADWIVTTEKDIMRLKGFALPDNLLALCIEFHVDDSFYAEAFGLRR
jgi:tetraacyldisaccharide 4'-kinase